ncbi:MAG: S-layer homology domain-containing protein, partial [Vallitaleaceae bacterium]|nr:S-layer homology domain-containing protein [Vallitaleaceae bacterium]
MRKKITAVILVMVLLLQCFWISFGATDLSILSEKVSNVYVARPVGGAIIKNIAFSDIGSHWAQEPISRLGALEIIKGYSDGRYHPGANVSKEVALALIMRVMGNEAASIQAAQTLAVTNPITDSLSTNWAKGYLQVASTAGLITAANLADALVADQSTLDPAVNFIRTDAATREQIAKWIVDAIALINPGQIAPIYTQQAIFNYSDWQNMGVDFTPYIEAVTQNKIMVGSGGRFDPKGSVTRAEMAQVIENIDEILYSTMKIDRKGGTVGAVNDSNDMNTLTGLSTRSFLIRNEDGLVDQLNFEYNKNALNQIGTKDAPVYQNGVLKGMMSLREGDTIEYLVSQATNELLYINKRGTGVKTEINGILQPLTDVSKGEITIKTEAGVLFTYQMRAGLYEAATSSIKIGQDFYNNDRAPVSHHITLTLQDNIVTDIAYEGDLRLYNEVSGIIKAINPKLSYLTIVDSQGKVVTKYYKKASVVVE